MMLLAFLCYISINTEIFDLQNHCWVLAGAFRRSGFEPRPPDEYTVMHYSAL